MPSIIIYTGATDISNSSVRALNVLTPIGIPSLVLGDSRDWSFAFTNGTAAESWSGSGSYSLKVGIGPSGQNPTGGTFTISGDGTILSGTTAEISNSATPADILAAITHVTTGLTVVATSTKITTAQISVGGSNTDFILDFKGTLANTTIGALVGDGENLTPAGSCVFSVIRGGGGGINARQAMRLRQVPYAFQDTWTTGAGAWTGTISTATESLALALGNETSIELPFEVEVTDNTGKRRTYFQGIVSIRNEVIDSEALVPVPLPDYYTAAETDALLELKSASDIQSFSNSAGDTSIVFGANLDILTAIVNISGAASDRNLILSTTDRQVGDILRLRINTGTTALVSIDVKSGGTSLTGGAPFVTDGTGNDNIFWSFYFDGTDWKSLGLIYPTL